MEWADRWKKNDRTLQTAALHQENSFQRATSCLESAGPFLHKTSTVAVVPDWPAASACPDSVGGCAVVGWHSCHPPTTVPMGDPTVAVRPSCGCPVSCDGHWPDAYAEQCAWYRGGEGCGTGIDARCSHRAVVATTQRQLARNPGSSRARVQRAPAARGATLGPVKGRGLAPGETTPLRNG